MTTTPKVLMAFPSTGHDISTRFMRSLVELDAFDTTYAYRLADELGGEPADHKVLTNWVSLEATANLAKARNRLVDSFLTDHPECDWLWFCDTDMVYPPETLHRMIGRALEFDVKIIGALCVIVLADGAVPTLFIDDPATVTRVMLDYEENTLAQVAATGTGCVLIHRSVLEDMQAARGGSRNAWFGFDILTAETGEEWSMGEDVSFCLRARDAGHLTYVDTTIQVGHHKGPRVWWPEDCRTHPHTPLDKTSDEAGMA